MNTLEQEEEDIDEDIYEGVTNDFIEEDDDVYAKQQPATIIPSAKLPISGYRDEIVQAIRENLVTMIEGM